MFVRPSLIFEIRAYQLSTSVLRAPFSHDMNNPFSSFDPKMPMTSILTATKARQTEDFRTNVVRKMEKTRTKKRDAAAKSFLQEEELVFGGPILCTANHF